MKKKLKILFVFILLSANVFGQYSNASSLWLTYLNAPSNHFDMIMADFKVDSTTLYTYYAAMCWNNGYCGVQRGGNGFFKHVHFSLWDPEGMYSEVIWHDYNVIVQRFGGEGTGWKTMWNFRWKEHQQYRLAVKCRVSDSTDYDAWFYNFEKNRWKHLAILRYPLTKYFDFLSSFLEDWAGTPESYRSYYLFNVRARIADDSSWFDFSQARYNINGSNPNCDGRVINNKFFLETGGTINPTNGDGTILSVAVNGFIPQAPKLDEIEIDTVADTGVGIVWHFTNGRWAAQESFSIEIANDENFDDVIFSVHKIVSSDTTYFSAVPDFDTTHTYYLKLNSENIFNLSDEKIISFTGRNVTSVTKNKNLPDTIILYQNYPNPFNPTTTISYSLPAINGAEISRQVGVVSLQIFNSLGQKVTTLVNNEQTPGKYSVKFDAKNFPAGIYFYTLEVGNFRMTKKMILLK